MSNEVRDYITPLICATKAGGTTPSPRSIPIPTLMIGRPSFILRQCTDIYGLNFEKWNEPSCFSTWGLLMALERQVLVRFLVGYEKTSGAPNATMPTFDPCGLDDFSSPYLYSLERVTSLEEYQ